MRVVHNDTRRNCDSENSHWYASGCRWRSWYCEIINHVSGIIPSPSFANKIPLYARLYDALTFTKCAVKPLPSGMEI